MNENEMYSGIADVLTDKPFTFTVPVKWLPPVPEMKISLWDRLRGIKPPMPPEPETHRTFDIYPCVVANMYRVAGRAAMLPGEILDGVELTESVMPLIPAHMPNMIYIIGAAIQNNHLEPDADLLLFIERNFTQYHIARALYFSIESLGLQAFLNSIVLVKGTVGILQPKTSPKDGSELIASHTAA
jgi:hypothetical protein